MPLLRSASRFDVIAEFDRDRGVLSEEVVPLKVAQSVKTAGQYCHLGGELLAIYADKNRVWLRIGDEELPAETLEAEWKGDGPVRRLVISRGQEVVRGFEYRLPIRPATQKHVQLGTTTKLDDTVDVTPFAELEDFDFGLFITNVVNDPDRREVLIQHLNEQPDKERSVPSLAGWKVRLLKLLMRRKNRKTGSREESESLAHR